MRNPISVQALLSRVKRAKKTGRKTVAVRRLESFLKGTFGDAPRRAKLFVLHAQGASSGLKLAVLASFFVVILSPYIQSGRTSLHVIKEAQASQSDSYITTISMNSNAALPKDNLFVIASSAIKSTLTPPAREQLILRRVWVPITAYSSTPDQTDSTPFITASGTQTRDGVIAANFLPIGTKVKIPTMFQDKVFTVEDRMNKRYWMRMDIWMSTREQALVFGLRTLPVEIIQEL